MDIIRITMSGYGCEINRGIVPEGKEKKIEDSLNNIWLKNLFEKLEEKTEITKVVKEVGLINGDIKIEVNDEVLVEMPIKSFSVLVENYKKIVHYPKTKDVVVTSVQHQEGIFSDTIFVLDGDFSLDRLTLVKKDFRDKVDNSIVSSLYCGIYYDGHLIPMMDDLTDLRMSRLYLEKVKKNEQKKNRKL